MGKSVFITGGAGFIGSRLVRTLKSQGYGPFVVYDSLHPQVHGPDAVFPEFSADVTCIKAQIEDAQALQGALAACDPDVVIHFVSETGTGQSLDELDRYVAANVTGTSNLLTAIGLLPKRQRDFLLSSSRSIYGEGPYIGPDGVPAHPEPRNYDAMKAGDFRVFDRAGRELTPVPAGPDTPSDPLSVYASTKLMQEHLLLNCAEAKNLRPKILRFQNVYGPGQSLRNPYTGVLSIFAAQIMAGKTLNIFEDGVMVRDFVFVDDVVNACAAALALDAPIARALNIGSGEEASILDAAKILIADLGGAADNFRITGDFRIGDIRYACADIGPTRAVIDWAPQTSLREGLRALADWTRGEIALTA
ncbi:NAD-dependent epimerase/dehydratase family protein [Asticcacaulis solisilvae]|uniref:NAD-dependent epimerase/dehydratase family protein n=1 Tax=Asticcacaulis solisilvae TaxID=1217274 RepID=UPI003FD6F15E